MRGQTMPCGFCGSALFLYVVMLCTLSCFAPSAASIAFAEGVESGIVFEERSVTTGQAQKILSVPLSPVGAREVHDVHDVSNARRATERPKTTENLLDSMDVYALSPHAARLALPRMIPQVAVEQWYASHEHGDEASQLSLGLTMSDWDAIIQSASASSGLDAALIAAVIRVESDFNMYAVSPKGAQGPMQIMPTTQEELGLVDAFNPHESVEAGSHYLRKQLDRFGSVELALAAYNAGAGNVERYGGIPPFKETQEYVRKVMQAYIGAIP